MISHIEANELFDLYGELLSQRQQEILSLYFQEDFSLSEIRENLGISKAAVYDALSKGIQAMEQYENKLHLRARERILNAWFADHPECGELEEALAKAAENSVSDAL